jgi:FdhD protein
MRDLDVILPAVSGNQSVRSVDVVRVENGERRDLSDRVAVERALEVRLDGEPFAVIMRTPGHDRHLAVGFLFTEGVLVSSRDVVAVQEVADDVVDVRLSPERALLLGDLLGSRRNVTMNSSCGMCGRRSLESLDIPTTPITAGWQMASSVISGLPDVLATAQAAFAETGGLHAAGLVDVDGVLEASAEDVGRHNAIDKLIGRMLLTGRLPLADRALVVSGRLSFEIVQKTYLAGLPIIVAVSAPSSLAVDLARQCGMTLAGFTRGGRFNVYAGAHRIGQAGS